jgi:hypothetical protein
MLCAENRTRALRHDGAEEALALHELEPADVLAVQGEHVEGDELKRSTPAHEIDKDGSAVLVELHFSPSSTASSASRSSESSEQRSANWR